MSETLERETAEGAVRLTMRLEVDQPLERLRALSNARKALTDWEREIISEARQAGQSWAEIGEALGVSKQAAWAAFNDDVRKVLDEFRTRSDLTDDEARDLVAEEVRAVRARRR